MHRAVTKRKIIEAQRGRLRGVTLLEGGRGWGREKVDSGLGNTGSREVQQAKEGMGMGWRERHATGWSEAAMGF